MRSTSPKLYSENYQNYQIKKEEWSKKSLSGG